jgi:hypothetical protein
VGCLSAHVDEAGQVIRQSFCISQVSPGLWASASLVLWTRATPLLWSSLKFPLCGLVGGGQSLHQRCPDSASSSLATYPPTTQPGRGVSPVLRSMWGESFVPWSPILSLWEGWLPQGWWWRGTWAPLGLGQGLGLGVCSPSLICDGVSSTQTVVNCCFV